MRISGGANGILVKSISSLICLYADNDGLIRDPTKKVKCHSGLRNK